MCEETFDFILILGFILSFWNMNHFFSKQLSSSFELFLYMLV
jgi:hypothetical protein